MSASLGDCLSPVLGIWDDVPNFLIEANEEERRQLGGSIFGASVNVCRTRVCRSRHGGADVESRHASGRAA